MAVVSDIVQLIEQRQRTLEGRWELRSDNNPL
jgi:hypothetical protein